MDYKQSIDAPTELVMGIIELNESKPFILTAIAVV